ncbi:hypothetical protein OSSY52_12750 [Tepiditoga spiralis]|uniref:CN hydrolase domain-containing protein n=1 Tax=Tepiditoga spiralis TaxID=2108365 RepID=A0A7G1G7H3_9BACT|nr:carbon-nitrogen hydrolase family protein [Tepiditoga spiralis]BBE31134.1 hypothetical protein OSSY52_12750 [Tepiditoga spiralis]
MKKIKTIVSMVQMESIYGNIDKNIKKHEYFIKKAQLNNSDIICFPELSLTGYNSNHDLNLAQTIKGNIIKKMKNLSKKYSMNLLFGFIEKEKKFYYITHVFIDKRQNDFYYRKIQLGENEKKYYTSGDTLKVFEYKTSNNEIIKFGIGICYDMHFPEHTYIYAKNGADLIFSPHASFFNAKRRIEIWNKYLSTRAYDNRVFILACNNLFDNHHKGGGICGWDNEGNLLNSYNLPKDYILNFELNIDKTKNKKDKFLKDKKVLIYKKYF